MIRMYTLFFMLFTANTYAACTSANKNLFDQGDGTIKNSHSGLIWMKCPLGMTWSNNSCEGQSKRLPWNNAALSGDYSSATSKGNVDTKKWRLPTIRELKTIAEKQCYDPSIDEAFFPNTLPSGYWSSTEDRSSSAHAMIMFFLNGQAYLSNKQEEWFVHLVRD